MTDYQYRTFTSMIDSGESVILDGPWATLLDWREALCYSVYMATTTGRKFKIHKAITSEGWFCYATRQEAPVPKNGTGVGNQKKLGI